ncbi:hypothetical protein Ahy_B06g082003 [Arachis hypogaea]|uniref:DNA2/NAM7 helicase helicase domain-containing protein n=1 Tax=Arachis hypogaea TaxID=3818 RepID=A0A444YMN9_ARAHY|nr:hypothetical protein Ahy_B06g082003 [Arachis hypogaea]
MQFEFLRSSLATLTLKLTESHLSRGWSRRRPLSSSPVYRFSRGRFRLKVVALCFRRCSVTVAALSRFVASESVEFEPIPIGSCSKENQSIYQQLFKLRRFSKALPYGVTHASKALEPATLVPLQLLKSSGTKCIMVGDPKQLPATVLSNVASKYLYECSMFERLQRAGHPVIMLTEQVHSLLLDLI